MLEDITQTDFSRTRELDNALRTHKGNRRTLNEDALLSHSLYPLFVIADGMGGHSAGDKASQYIVEQLSQIHFNEADLQARIHYIEASIHAINQDIINAQWVDDPAAIVGSTIVAAYIENNICTCFWVGDSRLYIYRDQRLYQMTRDHSMVQDLLDKGLITAQEARTHPNHNVLTRALGTDQEVVIDSNQFNLQAGDKLLLCSDGLYNELDSQNIIDCLEQQTSKQIAECLLQGVLAGTAADNVSVIVISK